MFCYSIWAVGGPERARCLGLRDQALGQGGLGIEIRDREGRGPENWPLPAPSTLSHASYGVLHQADAAGGWFSHGELLPVDQQVYNKHS